MEEVVETNAPFWIVSNHASKMQKAEKPEIMLCIQISQQSESDLGLIS